MLVKKWEKLPQSMQTDAVRPYYDRLRKKNFSLFWKRCFDFFVSSRQERVTQYGRKFRIFKFRTMVNNAEKLGSQVTVGNDMRVTKVGKFIRKCRLDEVSQLIDVWRGKMSFVGTRPEVPKYVERYSEEMLATLLLPAGVTSEASIKFKDEAEILKDAENVDDIYVEVVLPQKMEYNLQSLKKQGFWRDIGTMFKTVGAVLKR